jgi:hypothetical protein
MAALHVLGNALLEFCQCFGGLCRSIAIEQCGMNIIGRASHCALNNDIVAVL